MSVTQSLLLFGISDQITLFSVRFQATHYYHSLGLFEVKSRATLTFAVLAIGDFLRLVRRVPRHTVLAIVASCIVLASLTNAATLKVC